MEEFSSDDDNELMCASSALSVLQVDVDVLLLLAFTMSSLQVFIGFVVVQEVIS